MRLLGLPLQAVFYHGPVERKRADFREAAERPGVLRFRVAWPRDCHVKNQEFLLDQLEGLLIDSGNQVASYIPVIAESSRPDIKIISGIDRVDPVILSLINADLETLTKIWETICTEDLVNHEAKYTNVVRETETGIPFVTLILVIISVLLLIFLLFCIRPRQDTLTNMNYS